MRQRILDSMLAFLPGLIIGIVLGASLGGADMVIVNPRNASATQASVGETLTVLGESSSIQGAMGVATWYEYVPGHAAAGPVLREMLGPNWRGQSVIVAAGDRRVVVRLSDFCACSNRRGLPTLVDLDVRSFEALAPRSAGVVEVVVTTIPALPDTSTDHAAP